jgi:hypothetical protein
MMNKDELAIKANKGYTAWRNRSIHFGSMDHWFKWEELDYREQEAWLAVVDAIYNDGPSVCKDCGFYHPDGSCLDSRLNEEYK